MLSQKLQKRIRDGVQFLQRFTNRIWFAPFVALLAALDNFIVIVPTDGILISSSMLTPKRWFWLALNVAVGSTLGAIALAYLVEAHGLPWILEIYPNLNETRMWALTLEFFEKHGLLLVFAVAVTPFVQQPAVILASLAHTPYLELAVVIFAGRFIKCLIMAYVGSHAPRLLSKMWGVKSELKEVGVKVE